MWHEPAYRAKEGSQWKGQSVPGGGWQGRDTANVMVRDLDLGGPQETDVRNLEVVVDDGGCQLAVRRHNCECSPLCRIPTQRENVDGWCYRELAAGWSEHTQNWWGLEEGPDWLSWVSRLGGRTFLNQWATEPDKRLPHAQTGRTSVATEVGRNLACATARAVTTSLL